MAPFLLFFQENNTAFDGFIKSSGTFVFTSVSPPASENFQSRSLSHVVFPDDTVFIVVIIHRLFERLVEGFVYDRSRIKVREL